MKNLEVTVISTTCVCVYIYIISLTNVDAMSSRPFSRASHNGGSPLSFTTDISAPLVQMASTTSGSWLLMANCSAVCPSWVLVVEIKHIWTLVQNHLTTPISLVSNISCDITVSWLITAESAVNIYKSLTSHWCPPGAQEERGRSCCLVFGWPCGAGFVHWT